MEPVRIAGIYMNGRTSLRRAAYLELTGDSRIRIVLVGSPDTAAPAEGSTSFTLDFSELRIESRLGETPRELCFGAGHLFITEDNAAIDALAARFGGGRTGSLIHRLESNIPTIILALVATIALVGGVVVYGIPKAAELAAYKLPDFATSRLGSSLEVLDRTVFEPSGLQEARKRELQALFAPHLANYPGLNPSVAFRSGMNANAFALPDGQIVFTDDFVGLVERDEELVAVLYHELGHLQHRHIVRRALQGSMVTLLIIFVTGDIDSIDLLTGLPALVLDLSYSRDFEREADAFALENMPQAGISPRYFAAAMRHLEAYYAVGEGGVLGDGKLKALVDYLSTHPPSEERIQMMEAYDASER